MENFVLQPYLFILFYFFLLSDQVPCCGLYSEAEDIFSQRFLDYRVLLDYKATTKPQGSSPTPKSTYASESDEWNQDEVTAASFFSTSHVS